MSFSDFLFTLREMNVSVLVGLSTASHEKHASLLIFLLIILSFRPFSPPHSSCLYRSVIYFLCLYVQYVLYNIGGNGLTFWAPFSGIRGVTPYCATYWWEQFKQLQGIAAGESKREPALSCLGVSKWNRPHLSHVILRRQVNSPHIVPSPSLPTFSPPPNPQLQHPPPKNTLPASTLSPLVTIAGWGTQARRRDRPTADCSVTVMTWDAVMRWQGDTGVI